MLSAVFSLDGWSRVTGGRFSERRVCGRHAAFCEAGSRVFSREFSRCCGCLGGGGFGIKGAPAGLLRWLGSSVRVVGSKETP